MPNRAVSVLEFVQAVQGAVARDFVRENRNGNNVLIVQKVDLKLQTALTQEVNGEWKWKVITVGGRYAETQQQTLELSWSRKELASAAPLRDELEYELITGLDALRIGAKQWEGLSDKLPFKSTGGVLTFHLAVDEEGSLVVGGLGGGAASEQTHTVTLTLAPLP